MCDLYVGSYVFNERCLGNVIVLWSNEAKDDKVEIMTVEVVRKRVHDVNLL